MVRKPCNLSPGTEALMKPKSQPRDEFELFQAHFDQLLNPGHELILLANQIDWPGLDASYCQMSLMSR